jgi:hypothetical protein
MVFNSTSLNHGLSGEILSDFISIGRNFGLTGLFITTACRGELATRILRRSEFILGRLNSAEDIRLIKSLKGRMVADSTKELPKHSFIYTDRTDSEMSLETVLSFSKPKRYARRVSFTEVGLKPLVAPKSYPVPVEKKEFDYSIVYNYTMKTIGLMMLVGFIVLCS